MPFPHQPAVDLLVARNDRALDVFLAEHEATIHDLSDRGRSLLSLAVLFGDVDYVRSLLQRGVDPNNGKDAVRSAAGAPTEVLRIILDAGADPTLFPSGYSSPMQQAMGYQMHENVRLLRQYAKAFLAKKKGASVVAKRSKSKVDSQLDRHAEGLRRLFVDEPRWEIVAAKANVTDVAKRFEEMVQANAHKRLVPEEKAQLSLLRLHGMPWTLCVKRLGHYGLDGREWVRASGKAWSSSLGETIAFWGLQAFHYKDGKPIGERSWSIDDVDDDRLDEDEDLVDATEMRLFADMDVYLKKHDLLLPGMEDVSDGYCRRLNVIGIKLSDIEESAVVDLEKYDD